MQKNNILICKWPLSAHYSHPSLTFITYEFHMSNEEPAKNVWEKHEHDESLWKDTKQSEARKKLGYMGQ